MTLVPVRWLGRSTAAIAALTLLVAIAASAASAQRQVPQSEQQIQLSFAPLVKQAAPAVVNIFTRKTVTRESPLFSDPFFRRFFGEQFGFRQQRRETSLGSGVIVSPEGTIVTNNHVIEGADEITVILADRREFDARVMGTDERSDLAVLRIENGGAPFPFLEFKDSDDLEVGDLVLAIGNPFGVGQTVTSGIVSALSRTQTGINDMNFFIQTDAAINPGNSGGALLAMDGRLVGINTAIFSQSGGSVGIGFAIPSNMVRVVLEGVTTGGRLVRPWLGAEGQAVTADIAASLGLERPVGVLVNGIYEGGPASRAGLRVGDVILSVDGHEVDDPQGLRFRITTRSMGDIARVRIWRNGRVRNVNLRIEAPPETPRRETTELSGFHPLQGATVANLSPALAEEIGASLLLEGVVIMEIRRDSAARRFRFNPGDIVRKINGEEIRDVQQLKSILLRDVERWRMEIERDGKRLSLAINK